MSKKIYNQSNKPDNQANDVDGIEDVVVSGVTPDEGVNSINETEENGVDGYESTEQNVSVADTQESNVEGQEDGTATTNENDNETTTESDDVTNDGDNVPGTETKEDGVDGYESTEQNVSVADTQESNTDITEKEDAIQVDEEKINYFVSLGTVSNDKMSTVKERLMKAGINSAAMLGEELVVGPFTCKSNCIEFRKKILSKGLKGRIIER